jgi:hypothetical protein
MKLIQYFGFWVLTAVSMKMTAFWDVVRFTLVKKAVILSQFFPNLNIVCMNATWNLRSGKSRKDNFQLISQQSFLKIMLLKAIQRKHGI